MFSMYVLNQNYQSIVQGGKIQWQKTFGGTDGDVASSVIKVSDGYVFAGVTYSNDGDGISNHGSCDAWVVKIDLSENKVWQKVFGGRGHDEAASIVVAADGGYVIFGTTETNDGDVSGNHGYADAWALKN